MSATFRLELVTPERTMFSDEVTSVIAPAYDGYVGVLAGHAPMVCALLPGEIVVGAPSGTRYFATAGGFLEVSHGKAILLTDATEPVEDIDIERAEAARKQAMEQMGRRSEGIDIEAARVTLERADNRLREAKRRTRR